MNLEIWMDKSGMSQLEVAERLGVTQSAVSQWLRKSVPVRRVRDVVALTGGEVTAHDLQPDIYPAGFVFPVNEEPATLGQAA